MVMVRMVVRMVVLGHWRRVGRVVMVVVWEGVGIGPPIMSMELVVVPVMVMVRCWWSGVSAAADWRRSQLEHRDLEAGGEPGRRVALDD